MMQNPGVCGFADATPYLDSVALGDGLDLTAWSVAVKDVPRVTLVRPGDFRSYGHRDGDQ